MLCLSSRKIRTMIYSFSHEQINSPQESRTFVLEHKIKRKSPLVSSIKALIAAASLNSWKEVKFTNNYHTDVEILCFCHESWSGHNTYLFISLCYFLCLCMGCFREITHKMKAAHMCNASLWDHKRLRLVTGILKEGRHTIKYILN